MITLRPYTDADAEALTQAAQDKRIWVNHHCEYQSPEIFTSTWLESAKKHIASGKRELFVVCDGEAIIGSTSFYNIDKKHHTLALGYTWYMPSVWGTYVNPSAKLFMLEKAFEEYGMCRVAFHVDSINQRSQRAVLKLGAKQEGVLRKDKIRPDGTVRDTVIFSITDDDWPSVKASLEQRLASL